MSHADRTGPTRLGREPATEARGSCLGPESNGGPSVGPTLYPLSQPASAGFTDWRERKEGEGNAGLLLHAACPHWFSREPRR